MRKHFKHMGLSYIQKLLVFLSQRAAMKNRNTLRNCKAPGSASKWGQREKTSPSSGVCLRLFSYQSPNGVSWNSSAVLEQGSPLFLWDPQASSGVSVGSGLVTLHSIDLVTHRTTQRRESSHITMLKHSMDTQYWTCVPLLLGTENHGCT